MLYFKDIILEIVPEFKNLRSKLNLRSVIEILTITERTVYKHSTPQYSV